MAPDWAEALAPVDERIAAMGQFLRAELAAGPRLPAGGQRRLQGVPPTAGRRARADRRAGPLPHAGSPDRALLRRRARRTPAARGRSATSTRSSRPTSASRRPPHGDLTAWADRGVMLLNRVLTVRPGESASHRGRGWEEVTSCAIDALVRRGGPAAAILWGRDAQSLKPALGAVPWVESVHPSPAVRGPRLLRLAAVLPGEPAPGRPGWRAGRLVAADGARAWYTDRRHGPEPARGIKLNVQLFELS